MPDPDALAVVATRRQFIHAAERLALLATAFEYGRATHDEVQAALTAATAAWAAHRGAVLALQQSLRPAPGWDPVATPSLSEL